MKLIRIFHLLSVVTACPVLTSCTTKSEVKLTGSAPSTGAGIEDQELAALVNTYFSTGNDDYAAGMAKVLRASNRLPLDAIWLHMDLLRGDSYRRAAKPLRGKDDTEVLKILEFVLEAGDD